MNKKQKIVILITTLILVLMLLYPPVQYNIEVFTYNRDVKPVIEEKVETSEGWEWIFKLKTNRKESGSIMEGLKKIWDFHPKIRFDVLLCELLAMGILFAGLMLVIKGNKK